MKLISRTSEFSIQKPSENVDAIYYISFILFFRVWDINQILGLSIFYSQQESSMNEQVDEWINRLTNELMVINIVGDMKFSWPQQFLTKQFISREMFL